MTPDTTQHQDQPMTPDPFRAQLAAILDLHPNVTPTDTGIIAEAVAVLKRAEDAEMEIAKAHALLTDRGSITDDAGLLERVAAVLDQRDEARRDASDLATLIIRLRDAIRADDRMSDATVVEQVIARLTPDDTAQTDPAKVAAVAALFDELDACVEAGATASPHVVAALRALVGVSGG